MAPPIVIAPKTKRSPYVAALAESLSSPTEMKAGDHWSKGLANAFSKVAGTYLQTSEKSAENARKDALANALATGDKKAVMNALADIDPEKATGQFLSDHNRGAENSRADRIRAENWAREDKVRGESWARDDANRNATWAREDSRLTQSWDREDTRSEAAHKRALELADHNASIKQNKWSVETDPNTNKQYFFNERDGAVKYRDGGDGTVVPDTGAADAGAVPVGKPGKNDAGKALAGEMKSLSILGDIRKTDYKNLLTYQSQWKAAVGSAMSKFGMSEGDAGKWVDSQFGTQQTNKDYAALKLQVKDLFNQYRKEITGAAAAQKELEQLEQSFINMNMDPDTFDVAMGTLQSRLERSHAINRQLAKEGVLPGNKRYGEMFDAADALMRSEDQALDAASGGAPAAAGQQPLAPATAAPSAAAPSAAPEAALPALETLPAEAQSALQAGKWIQGPDGAKYRLVDGKLQKVE